MTPRPFVLGTARPASLLLAAAFVVLVAAGCGTAPATSVPGASSIPRSPVASVAAASPSESPPASTIAPTPAPSPSPVVRTDEPPAATLRSVAGDAVAGELGSFSWDGLTSDAPWIVPRRGGRTAPLGPLAIEFDPAIRPVAWVARWAPVPVASADGRVRGTQGSGEIRIPAPAQPGTWSLQVEVRIGDGRSATWYWRIEVIR